LAADEEVLQVDRSPHGPRLRTAPDQLACRLRARRPCGWSDLVEASIEEVTWSPGPAPTRPGLLWYRGAFRRWGE
jgi:hypothetical protein